MKAVQIRQFVEDFDALSVSDVAPPVAKSGEVLVQVKAAGVNFVDTLYARGQHQSNRRHVQPPFTLGLEFAGVVVSVGADAAAVDAVSSFVPGDCVYDSALGAFAEQIAVPASALHRIPDAWAGSGGSGSSAGSGSDSFAAAAGMAATLPVAYGALVARGRLQAGESVLVLGAAGGLGCMAVQVAKAVVGARGRVVAVASSAAKCAVARQCGADVCLVAAAAPQADEGASSPAAAPAAAPVWWQQVLDATEGRGVDVVFDPVGAVGDSIRCLAHRGRVLVVGFAARDGATLERVATNRVLLKQASIVGYRYGESLRRDPAENAQIWRALGPLVAAGRIRPVLYGRAFRGLAAVPAALQDLVARKVYGKAVITIDEDDEDDDEKKARL